MKQYPKIGHFDTDFLGENIIAFDKLDGSNLRFEFNWKKGWFKFGTRRTMFDQRDTTYGPSIELFKNKYGELLERIFKDKYSKVQNFTVFGEWFGEHSFAGQHLQEDRKDIVLFDVCLYKKGFISPYEFVDRFGHLDIPKIIYEGKLTEDFVESIRRDITLKEGVMCKNDDIVFKLKTNKWLNELKNKFGQKALDEEFA